MNSGKSGKAALADFVFEWTPFIPEAAGTVPEPPSDFRF